ncbi:MAG: hypothetical protein FWD55_05115 [Propionibacteriaceae bacterium]|nr:hypothetical protein [Propionibacteriaceae bacterium]
MSMGIAALASLMTDRITRDTADLTDHTAAEKISLAAETMIARALIVGIVRIDPGTIAGIDREEIAPGTIARIALGLIVEIGQIRIVRIVRGTTVGIVRVRIDPGTTVGIVRVRIDPGTTVGIVRVRIDPGTTVRIARERIAPGMIAGIDQIRIVRIDPGTTVRIAREGIAKTVLDMIVKIDRIGLATIVKISLGTTVRIGPARIVQGMIAKTALALTVKIDPDTTVRTVRTVMTANLVIAKTALALIAKIVRDTTATIAAAVTEGRTVQMIAPDIAAMTGIGLAGTTNPRVSRAAGKISQVRIARAGSVIHAHQVRGTPIPAEQAIPDRRASVTTVRGARARIDPPLLVWSRVRMNRRPRSFQKMRRCPVV